MIRPILVSYRCTGRQFNVGSGDRFRSYLEDRSAKDKSGSGTNPALHLASSVSVDNQHWRRSTSRASDPAGEQYAAADG